jgi:uncharacterized protein
MSNKINSMEQTKSLSAPLKRITVLDALRGFALLGVILIHMLQRFGINAIPSEQTDPLFPALDEAIQWVGQNIIMGRFINIFAFLFGLSFFIQMDSAARKGIDFRKRFVWRMLLLFLLGILAHSFYSLEIISVYAVFGLLMIPLYRFKNWTLVALACLLLVGTPRIIQATVNNKAISEQTEDRLISGNGQQAPAAVPEYIANPSFLNSAKHNYEERLEGKLNYQFGMVGRGYVTLALFILGLVVGRLRFFEAVGAKKKRNVLLFVGFVSAALLIGWIKSMIPPVELRTLFNPAGTYISPELLTVQALNDINLVLFSGAMTMGFIILYQTKSIGGYLDALSPYGRMGLTNYIMQGVIGSLLFSMWAFGPIFSGWHPTELFALGIIIYVAQIIFSKYWLTYFLYGPLEWLWRSATYLKRQPFRKTAPLKQMESRKAGKMEQPAYDSQQ